MQEEVEGRNLLKVTICFSGETTEDTDLSLDGDTRGEFRSHNEEVVVHTCMADFHRSIVAGVDIIMALASSILSVNRDRKREILLAVSS